MHLGWPFSTEKKMLNSTRSIAIQGYKPKPPLFFPGVSHSHISPFLFWSNHFSLLSSSPIMFVYFKWIQASKAANMHLYSGMSIYAHTHKKCLLKCGYLSYSSFTSFLFHCQVGLVCSKKLFIFIFIFCQGEQQRREQVVDLQISAVLKVIRLLNITQRVLPYYTCTILSSQPKSIQVG